MNKIDFRITVTIALVGLLALGLPLRAQDLEKWQRDEDVRSLRRFIYQMGPRPSELAIQRTVHRAKANDADGETLFWAAECRANHWTKDGDFASLVERAAEKKFPAGIALYGYALCLGQDGVPKEPAKGIELVRNAALSGEPLGLHYLSWIYLVGYPGAQSDLAKAAAIAQQSLEKGMTRNLGLLAKIADQMHDANMSEVYALRAAEAGDPEMMLYMYETKLKAKNKEQAEFWLRRGALFGNHEMMRRYAIAMEEGRGGLERDSMLSRALLERAASEGDDDSAANLAYGRVARIYGFDRDVKGGMAMLTQLAKRDVAVAQYYLGMFLTSGTLVDKDAEAGAIWLRKAAAHGNEAAKRALEEQSQGKSPPVP